MTSDLAELLQALDALSVQARTATPEQAEAILQQRKSVLDALAALNLPSLPAAVRQNVRARLLQVQQGERAILQHLQVQLRQLQDARTKVVQARRAARGYGSALQGQPVCLSERV